ncbi:MAG: ribbon-helix-helix protein, CopG family [Anaerolineae bacterium]|nr:ribbon-helix-helix protein, CopG family [Anaerolineae bacterium]MCB0200234.1 ribbon-helix-helix protein, CopG family [Anaerolineae bacterium]MCB0205783.1 ribbon-helix-helix protein, CopG family [Anaerolineae bacterium]
MRRTQIYLEEEQHRQLQEIAEQQHTTMAHVIREAIETYMVRSVENEDALLGIIALGASGDTDGSFEHDRDIYEGA